jgi:hypothetical protein
MWNTLERRERHDIAVLATLSWNEEALKSSQHRRMYAYIPVEVRGNYHNLDMAVKNFKTFMSNKTMVSTFVLQHH